MSIDQKFGVFIQPVETPLDAAVELVQMAKGTKEFAGKLSIVTMEEGGETFAAAVTGTSPRGEAFAHRIAGLLNIQALPQESGDLLPKIGDPVLIYLARQNAWVPHTVVGFYAWGDIGFNPYLQRVFVRVQNADGSLNSRMLHEVLRLDGTSFVPPGIRDDKIEALQHRIAAVLLGKSAEVTAVLRDCLQFISSSRPASEPEAPNLNNPAAQKRLATQWGYVPASCAPARSDAEIVKQTESLALQLMKEIYNREPVDPGVSMRESKDPRAAHCWNLACQAQELLTQTDPEDAVSALDN